MENRPKVTQNSELDHQSWPHEWKQNGCFHSGPHDYDYVYKVAQCLRDVLYHHTGMMVLYIFFLTGFWMKKRYWGYTTNFSSVLGGYLSLCGLRDWFSPSHYIDETPSGGSSGNSSCADNFELSYLVTVQTRVNAQICFRCLSLCGSISSCFCFQG